MPYPLAYRTRRIVFLVAILFPTATLAYIAIPRDVGLPSSTAARTQDIAIGDLGTAAHKTPFMPSVSALAQHGASSRAVVGTEDLVLASALNASARDAAIIQQREGSGGTFAGSAFRPSRSSSGTSFVAGSLGGGGGLVGGGGMGETNARNQTTTSISTSRVTSKVTTKVTTSPKPPAAPPAKGGSAGSSNSSSSAPAPAPVAPVVAASLPPTVAPGLVVAAVTPAQSFAPVPPNLPTPPLGPPTIVVSNGPTSPHAPTSSPSPSPSPAPEPISMLLLAGGLGVAYVGRRFVA